MTFSQVTLRSWTSFLVSTISSIPLVVSVSFILLSSMFFGVLLSGVIIYYHLIVIMSDTFISIPELK